jgi:GH15 family glucan-1,4-alpha-glucosidase
MSLQIEEYALIGDCETAALVGRDGSINWLCFPRFDAGACFAALLGSEENGRWSLAPAGKIRHIRRRYQTDTLILETEFETDEGIVTLIDWMPPRQISDAPHVMRMVVGKSGQVRMRLDLIVRFDYGWIVPWVEEIDDGIRIAAGPDSLYFSTELPLQSENTGTVAEFTVAEGQRIPFTLTWASAFMDRPSGIDPEQSLRQTTAWWHEWTGRCTYEGEWQDMVVRSLITLKALTYAPTGGIVAAPTTSLPEKLGGERNWDYRYCWLRDATFTLYALIIGGYTEEASHWREWLVNAVAGRPETMHIMYGLAGERRLPELELEWLPGYKESQPVRIGNAAYDQHQLDVYGEVMDALHLARRTDLPISHDAWRVQKGIMRFLEKDWQEPDNGIWEMRGPKRHFTHSKVMAWVAADRAVKAVEEFGLEGPVEKWRLLRKKIHDEVCDQGFDSELNTFVQYYGAETVDASLLMIPLVGFLPADDPRMLGTVEAIEKELLEDGFVHRYDTDLEIDGLPPGEGTFLLCTFWLVDNYALQGRHDEARALFERLLDLCNDVGLLAEEYDPAAGHFLGNFPQAFSHIGLINSACNLSRADGPAVERRHQ